MATGRVEDAHMEATTVVIACCNEESTIEETLDYVLALTKVRTPLVATVDADTLLTPPAPRRVVARLLVSPSDTVAVAGAPENAKAFARQRRRWARGMIEGLREHGGALLRGKGANAHAVLVNFVFPFIDVVYSVAFPIGIVLALFGNFAIVGPMTLVIAGSRPAERWALSREIAPVKEPGAKRRYGHCRDGDATEGHRFDAVFDRVSVVLEDRDVANAREVGVEPAN
jgi:hypothetical protein